MPRISSPSIFRVLHSGVADARNDALLRTDAYRYELPPELIASVPADPPESARLMVLRERTIEHKTFADFPSLLRTGDVLVINETRVIRARLHGRREPGGGHAELFLLRPASGGAFDFAAREWTALAKPGRKLQVGTRVLFGDDATARVLEVRTGGVRVVHVDTRLALEELLERHGEMPLPPYVGRGTAARDARYQTVFARVPGSVAAPTASLHFTPNVLAEIHARGVTVVPLVLDVGLGTFKPMETESIRDHVMHAERYDIPSATAQEVNRAKDERRRVVVAGTTVLRALEAAALSTGRVLSGPSDTDIFIAPGFRFAVADALLTNFHLPASTLLVLICAFAGYRRALGAYDEAIAQQYRFYSFGDAMWIERREDP